VLQAVCNNPEIGPVELAKELGANRNSIYAALHRARKQLRDHAGIEAHR
jgi:DNA-directed RNA polymerase specialized sigma24 family protein